MSTIKELNEQYETSINEAVDVKQKVLLLTQYRRHILTAAINEAELRKLTPAEAAICRKFIDF